MFRYADFDKFESCDFLSYARKQFFVFVFDSGGTKESPSIKFVQLPHFLLSFLTLFNQNFEEKLDLKYDIFD